MAQFEVLFFQFYIVFKWPNLTSTGPTITQLKGRKMIFLVSNKLLFHRNLKWILSCLFPSSDPSEVFKPYSPPAERDCIISLQYVFSEHFMKTKANQESVYSRSDSSEVTVPFTVVGALQVSSIQYCIDLAMTMLQMALVQCHYSTSYIF